MGPKILKGQLYHLNVHNKFMGPDRVNSRVLKELVGVTAGPLCHDPWVWGMMFVINSHQADQRHQTMCQGALKLLLCSCHNSGNEPTIYTKKVLVNKPLHFYNILPQKVLAKETLIF